MPCRGLPTVTALQGRVMGCPCCWWWCRVVVLVDRHPKKRKPTPWLRRRRQPHTSNTLCLACSVLGGRWQQSCGTVLVTPVVAGRGASGTTQDECRKSSVFRLNAHVITPMESNHQYNSIECAHQHRVLARVPVCRGGASERGPMPVPSHSPVPPATYRTSKYCRCRVQLQQQRPPMDSTFV